ncbi:hypothetical protein BD289DRAFT_264471 [Coniella lustricola]|uniref:D-xylose 1-dehydrogenase (NADP(+), D-xylono-1,5-lactone-forming) n=1 Tax=Coniella lustricola TaxID=2025994 RepID=A0A2T3A7J2_9PEZI|nr:hypothetical protein BD289DRAFT_264471 [Coniella lustricola]
MGAFLSALRRNQRLVFTPVVAKHDGALKIGILGAADIAPIALVNPARSNPNVVVYAVAARDKSRAAAFAKKHGIPHVKDSYDDLLNDPNIDAVYNPLPNGLHFEWTHKALAKGKHVLLEKPLTSNAEEAEALFNCELLSASRSANSGQGQAQPLILLEAFHSRFSPAFALFRTLLDQPNIEHVFASLYAPAFLFGSDNIRFQYDLGGGAAMDVGTYTIAALREAFGAEPTECMLADLERMPPPLDQCDVNFHAQLRFPNGGIGEVKGGLKGPRGLWPVEFPLIQVTHRPVAVAAADCHGLNGVSERDEVTKKRTVTFVNFILSPHYHRIEVEDEYVISSPASTGDGSRTDGTRTRRVLIKKETRKAYSWKEMGRDLPGEPWLSTYGYMLQEFVDKIQGREGTGVWISGEDSIAQMKAIDMVYEKSGLGVRPTSVYRAKVV